MCGGEEAKCEEILNKLSVAQNQLAHQRHISEAPLKEDQAKPDCLLQDVEEMSAAGGQPKVSHE